MMLARQNRWHLETAKTAASAPAYLRAFCGRSVIEQLKGNPSLDPGPPDS